MKYFYPLLYGRAMGVITLIFALFHIAIILGLIPETIVWGGRIGDRERLVRMEIFSLITILLSGTLGFVRGSQLSRGIDRGAMVVFMWILVCLFALNTAGNIFAKTRFERFAFTPVTVVLTCLSLRLALGR